ncbi:hypothetical protein BGZ63DRAFT_104473 [Mariannaea sp. PMI_226]|nr:hypothetical protein BGZ63DRAFT_104473 [Mariannaea sp. PMI_226]
MLGQVFVLDSGFLFFSPPPLLSISPSQPTNQLQVTQTGGGERGFYLSRNGISIGRTSQEQKFDACTVQHRDRPRGLTEVKGWLESAQSTYLPFPFYTQECPAPRFGNQVFRASIWPPIIQPIETPSLGLLSGSGYRTVINFLFLFS